MILLLKIRDSLFPSLHTWKEFDCLSTISTPLVLIMMPAKLRSPEAQRYFIFKPMSHWKLSERTQLFSSPTCPKFYDIDIGEITELLLRKHDIFTTRGECSTYLFERADKNDVMVTRFSKMAVLLFTKGSFLYYEHQVWFSFKFRGKIYFVIIFNVKIKGSCPLAELPAGVMCIRCSSESMTALTRLV